MTDVDHHADEVLEPVEDNPIWQQDNVTLRSVGIDVGSSGTQVAFSVLHLRRLGEDLTSRYSVVRRETVFQSEVRLTPYVDERLIDATGLAEIVGDAYQSAGMHPDGIDTGVVVLTGEAVRRENAERIAHVLSGHGGELVCAAAGHHMESRLAAFGSGAARASHDDRSRILNIDIGGGTTKFALIEAGRVLATAAVQVGGRLQVVDEAGRITRLEPGGREHARRAGFTWAPGSKAEPVELDRVAEAMAEVLVSALAVRPLPDPVRELFLTEPIEAVGHLDAITFSGGVGEYVYGRETRDFGDLGARLGAALRRHVEDGALPAPVVPVAERIRATVLGASEYTVQLSGNTSYISRPDALLPRRNLQVVRPTYPLDGVVEPEDLAARIRAHLASFDIDPATADVALAFSWAGAPAYERLVRFARGIVDGLTERVQRGLPIYLVLDGDVALTLGSILRDELAVCGDLLVIDGVRLADFDYVDLGSIREPSRTVPVTIKSLVFGHANH